MMFWHAPRENLGSMPFWYRNLIISHQPAAVLIVPIPGDSGSMHGEVTAALNRSYYDGDGRPAVCTSLGVFQ